MFHSTAGTLKRQIEMVRGQFAQKDGLAFADVLPAQRIEQALQAEGANWRDCVYTPALTLWAFLNQIISLNIVGGNNFFNGWFAFCNSPGFIKDNSVYFGKYFKAR